MSDHTPHHADPAGNEATRLARGKRNMERLATDPTAASAFAVLASGTGTPAADPFAPLSAVPPSAAGTSTKAAETWAPSMPAPEEPPEADRIRHSKFGCAARRWVYRGAAGQPLFAVARFEHTAPDGQVRKETLPYSYGRRIWSTPKGAPRDQTGWHFKRPALPVPLYGLDRLAERADAPVVVTEGEKAADGAEAYLPDTVAVTSQGGSGAADKADWTPLAGRNITVWPDHDEAGAAYASQVVQEAFAVGAASVRVVSVPEAWPEGWDLGDDLPEGATADTVRALLAEAPIAASAATAAIKGEGAPPDLSAAELDAEIDRLSLLPRPEYARTRKRAAQALAMGVGDLDSCVDQKRAARKAEAQARFREQPPPAAGAVRWPLGIFQREDGLYADSGDDAPPMWLCDLIEVLGQGRDAASESWGLFLRWQDPDHHVHTWPMPARMTMVQPGELEAALADRGLRISGDTNAKLHLRRALIGVQSGSRVIFADAPGWTASGNGPAAFTLIDGTVIGEAAEHIVLKSPPENAVHKVRTAGTLDTWKDEIAAKAQGNPGAAFAICMAFAGTLLEPLGESSGGFHFHGRSKAGKTLIAKMGVSVWGAPKKAGLLRDWRSTSNALESAAEECNDGFLPLDEVHQAEAKEVVAAVYQLANESGKGRLSRDAIAKKRRTWRTMVLSTGEITIAQMAAKAGQTLPAGAEVRLPSIPIDGQDLWPSLHGEVAHHALMAQLQRALLHSYGTPIRAFLARLTEVLAANDGSLEAAIELQRDAFYARLPDDTDGQVKDVARRCALIALAGELATEWGILPWAYGDATEAAEVVMDWWIGRRGGTGSTEESQHVRAVRAYLSEYRLSRFIPLRWETDERNVGRWVEQNPENRLLSISGWRRMGKDQDQDQEQDAEEFILDGDGWEKLCGASSADPAEVAKTLAAAGHLDVDADGRNLMKHTRVPGRSRFRAYVVRGTIFASTNQVPAEAAA